MTPGERSDRDVDNQIGQQQTGQAANPTQTDGPRLRDEGIRAVPGTEGQASATATARRSVAGAASDRPRCRTFPAATSSDIAPTVSSMGTSGSRRAGR